MYNGLYFLCCWCYSMFVFNAYFYNICRLHPYARLLFVSSSAPLWGLFVFATCDGWACDFYPPNILVSTQTKCNVLRGASGQGNQSGRKQRRDQLFLLHKTSFSTTAGCRNNTLSLSLSVLFHLLSITLSSTATNPVVRAVHSICYPVSSLRDNLPSGLVELSWRKTVVHDGNESLTSPKRNLKPNPV